MRSAAGRGGARSSAGDGSLDLFAADPAGTAATAPRGPELATPLALRIPGASPELAVPVGALTQTARDILESTLPPLWVRGEVSDFKRHRNGHWYFCLRDAAAQVRCVVWARDQRGIPAAPDDGMEVAAFGQLTVYPARGEMQLTVRRMEARGDGLWRKALEETRQRLERDGLLEPARKRAIPALPQRVAVVTSPDGAALRDVIAVITRRAPHVAIAVSPARVQGDGAPEELCAAIERVTRWGAADVLIIGRGGGAREDLWAFNDERVARAIAACPVPVISAVGHEIDVTIADLVADLRAPTPSAAAEAAVPLREALFGQLADARDALCTGARRVTRAAAADLARAARSVHRAGVLDLERRRGAIAGAAGRLEALSPLATLSRGYAIPRDPATRATLGSVSAFAPGIPFELVLRDGSVVATPVEHGLPGAPA